MSDIIFILASLVLSFGVTFLLMPCGIRFFIRHGIGKNIRSEWLIWKATEFAKMHEWKSGTPTMGGSFILMSMGIIILLSIWIQQIDPNIKNILGFKINHSLWNQKETYIPIFTLFSVWIIWILDDYMNIRWIGKTKGLSAGIKMGLLIIFWCLGAGWFYYKLWYTEFTIPWIWHVDIGIYYMILFILILIAGANSVNITDGLDGLAWGLLLFQYAAYGFITYSKGLFILSAFCFIIVWWLIAFLWFNIHPARIFMWDVGSLALWATLAVIALLTDTLLPFVVMSSIFILETISVILQMASKKLRNGKKIFRVAPFHHHLEAIGWKEETIVMRFWLIGMVLAVAWSILTMI
jgi:phospho-N-acetylmuramoyl-pentapeptide-transferase